MVFLTIWFLDLCLMNVIILVRKITFFLKTRPFEKRSFTHMLYTMSTQTQIVYGLGKDDIKSNLET